jgi:hypothetical protein
VFGWRTLWTKIERLRRSGKCHYEINGTAAKVSLGSAAEWGTIILISVNSPGCVLTSIEPACCLKTMSLLTIRPQYQRHTDRGSRFLGGLVRSVHFQSVAVPVKWLLATAFLLLCMVTARAGTITLLGPGGPSGGFGATTPTPQVPGPSAALYNNHPYYTCNTNRYVATAANGGKSTNDGSQPTQGAGNVGPWDIITAVSWNASASGTGSWCVNVTPGSYNLAAGTIVGSASLPILNGGTTASTTGYVVWRCTLMPFSYSGGALQGEGNGCVISQAGGNGDFFLIAVGASYVMFDALEVSGTSVNQGDCISNKGSNGANHHTWILNSDIHGCGEAGMSLNDTEWLFIIHSHWHDNAETNGDDGSGLSVFEPVVTSGYTPTAQDNQFCSSTAGICFQIVAEYNVGVHNFNNFPGCTDGEGIIFDDWGHQQKPGIPYANNGLALGNIMFFNGGGGVQSFSQNPGTGKTWFVNNTTYNNYWSTCNSGTFRADNYVDIVSNLTNINNIAYAVVGSGVLANNAPFIGKRPTTSAGSGNNTWGTNVAFPGVGGFDSPNAFPKVGDHHNLNNTDPKFVSVTTSSTANNFALQAGSPAIGFGQAFDLWQQSGSVDAGACVSSLSVCP